MLNTKNVKYFIGIAGILLICYIFTLIIITYSDQKKIEEYQNKEIESNIKSRAITLEYFFNSLKNDLIDLDEKRVFSSYFANKDLGMSMEYGLKASLLKIDKLLAEFLENKNINNVKMFKEITVYTTNGELLSSTNKNNHIDLKELSLNESNYPEIFINNNSNHKETYIFKSLYYKNILVANLIASINLEDILKQLSLSNNKNFILTSEDELLAKNSLLLKIEENNKYLSIKINGTPYTLYGLKTFENDKTFSSEWFVLSLLFLAIVVLLTIYYVFLLNNRNIKLTEEKNSERLLLQQSKVAAVGEMLGNISHQWRQPLSVISVEATGLKLSLEYDKEINKEDIIKSMEHINNQAQYLSKTVDDFRNFFRGDINDIHEFNIKDLFDKLENLTKDSLINNHIKYKFEIDDCKISGNENLLIQALINIFNNAKDALVEKPNQYEDRLFFIFVKKDKNSLQIKIRDNAGGIKDSIIDKIFDPYFTTKHKFQGTGLGLFVCSQIVIEHFHGNITCENILKEDEKGCRFLITFPIL